MLNIQYKNYSNSQASYRTSFGQNPENRDGIDGEANKSQLLEKLAPLYSILSDPGSKIENSWISNPGGDEYTAGYEINNKNKNRPYDYVTYDVAAKPDTIKVTVKKHLTLFDRLTVTKNENGGVTYTYDTQPYTPPPANAPYETYKADFSGEEDQNNNLARKVKDILLRH